MRRIPLALTVAAFATACSDLTSPEVDAPVAEATLTTTVVAENPTQGAYLKGLVIFRARVEGLAPWQYRMKWSVDGGYETAMRDAVGADEAWVELSQWKWNGAGPYRITFRAYDGRSRVMGQTSVDFYIGDAPAPPPPAAAIGGNPFTGARFFVEPYSNARQTADLWRASRPQDAAYMDILASRPQAEWFGDWISDIRSAVSSRVSTITAAGAFPVFVAYNIVTRDCNWYSAGGVANADAYRAWIRGFADGLAGRRAAVILEPDALSDFSCLSAEAQAERIALLKDAVTVLSAAGASVYIDAGNARWHAPETIAARLHSAGIAQAAGFALNTSNFVATAESVTYGQVVSALVGGKGFVVDTSRNGLGSAPNNEWCNPDGRALGVIPTVNTGAAGAHAFLYVKRPGESDGTCNGGPTAGAWWPEYALGVVERSVGNNAVTN